MDDLSVKVRDFDLIRIGDADEAHAGGGEVESDRRTQTARPDAQDGGVADLALTGQADFRKDQMAGVSANLLIGELKHTKEKEVRPLPADAKEKFGFCRRISRKLLSDRNPL